MASLQSLIMMNEKKEKHLSFKIYFTDLLIKFQISFVLMMVAIFHLYLMVLLQQAQVVCLLSHLHE